MYSHNNGYSEYSETSQFSQCRIHHRLPTPIPDTPPIVAPSTSLQSKRSKSGSRNLSKQRIDTSYFTNHDHLHQRHKSAASQIHHILDRTESRDLHCIFHDELLCNTQRAHQLYHCVVELHQYLIKYPYEYVLPYVARNAHELNVLFVKIVKLFHKYKRVKHSILHHRRLSISKSSPKNTMSKLRDGLDDCLHKIGNYNDLIIHGLQRSSELVDTFDGNLKLLSFWVALFASSSEREYKRLTWNTLAVKITNHKSCRRLKQFPLFQLVAILKEKFNVEVEEEYVSCAEFARFTRQYSSISAWSHSIIKYAEQQRTFAAHNKDAQNKPFSIQIDCHSPALSEMASTRNGLDLSPQLITAATSWTGSSEDGDHEPFPTINFLEQKHAAIDMDDGEHEDEDEEEKEVRTVHERTATISSPHSNSGPGDRLAAKIKSSSESMVSSSITNSSAACILQELASRSQPSMHNAFRFKSDTIHSMKTSKSYHSTARSYQSPRAQLAGYSPNMQILSRQNGKNNTQNQPRIHHSLSSRGRMSKMLRSQPRLPSLDTCTSASNLAAAADPTEKRLHSPILSLLGSESPTISGYDSSLSIDTFSMDETSYHGHSVHRTPRSALSPISPKEPFDNVAIKIIRDDLSQSDIIHHGLFKLFSPILASYIGIAGVLTSDRLYLISALKYQVWRDFVERSKIEYAINVKQRNEDSRIDRELAVKLIKNMHILEDERCERLLPYFEHRSKKEIMLYMLLNNLSRDKVKKLSSYFHLNEDIFGYNSVLDLHCDIDYVAKEPAKDVKYVQITSFNDPYVLPKQLKEAFLEYVLKDVEYIKEDIIEDSIVITLDQYHYERVVDEMSDRKKQYFIENQLVHEDMMEIKDYTGYRVKYSFTEPKVIDLTKFTKVTPFQMYESADSYGFRLCKNHSKSEAVFRMNCNNVRQEWVTHIDYVLNQHQRIRQKTEKKKHAQKNKVEEAEPGVWYYQQSTPPCDAQSVQKPASQQQTASVEHTEQALILNDSSFYDYDNEANATLYEEIKEEEHIGPNAKDNPTKQKLINDFSEKPTDDQKEHKEDEADEETKESESKNDDEDAGYVKDFNFGQYLNYWQGGYENSVIAKYPTLKEELLKNKIARISESDYYQLYKQCVNLYKLRGFMIRAQQISSNNEKCNIPENMPLTINHLIALKIYTDYTKTQNAFKKHCRRLNEQETIKQLIERNSEIGNWCRYLMEAVTFYGTKMESKHVSKYVYTGLKDKLIFASLTQHFYCPLSTTESISVAQNYREHDGVILQLKAADSKSRYFDVSWLSWYKFEDERLIMGAAFKIHDIIIGTKSCRKYIAALHLLEQLLNGYEFDAKEEAEHELYKMLAILLQINDVEVIHYEMPPYIRHLLNKRICKMQQQMQSNDELQRLWINNTTITRLRNKKLKCLFAGCDASQWAYCCGIRADHRCGEFFHFFHIDISKINKVTRFSWTIDAEYEQFKNMKARKYLQSEVFAYCLNGHGQKEKIEFYLTCYAKYTHESGKCALFIHLYSMPVHIESIKIEYDILCEYGGKKKYQHIMIPQVLDKERQYCGCQTFRSNKLKLNNFIIWNVGVKIIEVNYAQHAMLYDCHDDYDCDEPYVPAMDAVRDHDIDDKFDISSCGKDQLLDMLKVMMSKYDDVNNHNHWLQMQNQQLLRQNQALKMTNLQQK